MWKYRLLAPDSWGTHQNFWEPRLLHLPIHRKVVNSLTWDTWFSFIYNKFLMLRLPALCCKITIESVSSPFLLEKFLRALWKFISWTMLCLVAQSCLISAVPWIVDCQAALSMAILQVRILEWAAMPPRPSFRGSSQPRNGTQVPGLCNCSHLSYCLSHQGSPRMSQAAAYPFSSRPPGLRNWIGVTCITGGFFTSWATKEAPNL